MAIWNSDGSLTNVPNGIQTIHDNAATHNGDTITVPAGTFTWTTELQLTKSVIIMGQNTTNVDAGTYGGETTIVDNKSDNNRLISFRNGPGALGPRVSGLCFTKGAAITGQQWAILEFIGNNSGAVPTSPVRIDHCVIDGTFSVANEGTGAITQYIQSGVWLGTYNYGVFDHNVITSLISTVKGQQGDQSDGGDFDWNVPTNFGGADWYFTETNYMLHGIGIAMGSKMVVRYNHLRGDLHSVVVDEISALVVDHETGRNGAARGGRAWDVYQNDFHWHQDGKVLDGSGSGSAYYHDNTWTNTGLTVGGIAIDNQRQIHLFGGQPFGMCTGFNPWDQNATRVDGTWHDGEAPYAFVTSTTTAGSAGVTLVDSTQNWTPNQWVGYTVNQPATNMGGMIFSNTPTSLTTVGDIAFAPGQAYRIGLMLHALDDPGQGSGDLINRAAPAWPHQVSDPQYSYNNIVTDNNNQHVNCVPHDYNKQVKLGRDYFSDTPMPGYIPYVYPHPLVSGSSTGKIISLSGTGLAFGNVTIGNAPTGTLMVSNTGDTVMTVTSISYPAGFSGATTGFVVAPSATQNVTVTFTPLLAQLYSGNIVVTSDATSGNNTIAVSGTGVPPIGPPPTHKKRARDAYATGM